MLKYILTKLNSLFYLKFNQSLNWFITFHVNVALLPLKDAMSKQSKKGY